MLGFNRLTAYISRPSGFYAVFRSVSLTMAGTLVYCSMSTVSEPKAVVKKARRELLLIGFCCESSINQVWNYDSETRFS